VLGRATPVLAIARKIYRTSRTGDPPREETDPLQICFVALLAAARSPTPTNKMLAGLHLEAIDQAGSPAPTCPGNGELLAAPLRLPRAATAAAAVVVHPRRTRGGAGGADAGRRQLLGGGRGAPAHRHQFLRTLVNFYHAYAIPVRVLNTKKKIARTNVPSIDHTRLNSVTHRCHWSEKLAPEVTLVVRESSEVKSESFLGRIKSAVPVLLKVLCMSCSFAVREGRVHPAQP
jgi:hypothetical protein